MRLLSTFASCTLAATVAAGSFEDDLVQLLQPAINEKADFYNCSIGVAAHFSNGSKVAAIAGYKDYVQKTAATLEDRFIWGSVTKVLTGSSILKAQEQGLLNITDSIVPHIDPILKKMAASDPTMKFSSLEEIFGKDVESVTVEDLARMRSGIPDYDTAKPSGVPPTDAFRGLCYKNATEDYSPQDMLGVSWVAKGHLDFQPGTKYAYSSTNFVLLGLLLAELYGATWQTYDQGAIIPATSKSNTVFGVTGPPSAYTEVHGYDRTSYNGNVANTPPGIDVDGIHCVYAGWTASDYTASLQDAADFTYDIYGPESTGLTPASQAIMNPSTAYYGFATFNLDRYTGLSTSDPHGIAYGHLGATYGYQSVVLFFPALNMSLAVGSNIETTYQAQPSDTVCSVYNIVRSYVTGEAPLNCSYDTKSYYGYCVCK